MAKKKVTFNDQTDGQGVEDRRAEMEEVDEGEEVASPTPTPSDHAHMCLDEMATAFKQHKDDKLAEEFGISHVDGYMVLDMHNRKVAGKKLHFSEGNIERLSMMHKDLKSKGKI